MEVLRSPVCSIVDLNLGCNEIWEEGGKAIGEMLRVNKSVGVILLFLFTSGSFRTLN